MQAYNTYTISFLTDVLKTIDSQLLAAAQERKRTWEDVYIFALSYFSIFNISKFHLTLNYCLEKWYEILESSWYCLDLCSWWDTSFQNRKGFWNLFESVSVCKTEHVIVEVRLSHPYVFTRICPFDLISVAMK